MIKNCFSSIFRANKLFINSPVRKPSDVHVEKYVSSVSCNSSKFSMKEGSDSEYSDNTSEEFDFECESEAMDSHIEKLCANDLEKLARLKSTRLLVSLLRHKGKEIPQQLTDTQWMHLLSYENKKNQIGYLANLYKREKHRKYLKAVSDIGKIQYLRTKEREQERGPIQITTSGPVIHQLRYNSLFYRILDPAIDKFYNYKLLQAMMFAPTAIVDCGFESRMKEKEIDVIAQRIVQMWSYNRNQLSPFHIQCCNLDLEGRLMEKMREYIPCMDDPAYPFFYTTKSYLELYPPDRLVYLSSDAHSELKEYNSDDNYIIGGLGNHLSDKPLTKLKAQREGIRTFKFPIKRYNAKLHSSQHSLDLITVISILNDIKETNDWKYAFRHLTDRKYIAQHREEKVSPDHSLKSRQRLGLMYDLLLTKSK